MQAVLSPCEYLIEVKCSVIEPQKFVLYDTIQGFCTNQGLAFPQEDLATVTANITSSYCKLL